MVAIKQRQPPMATERNEMQITFSVVSFQMSRHPSRNAHTFLQKGWGTLVSSPHGELRKWYPLLVRPRQAETFGESCAPPAYTPDRLLLQSLAYSKGSTPLFSTNYWYKTDSTNCPNAPAGNNGQIQCITDNVDSGRTVSYTYDSLYRLTSAVTNGSANYVKWGLTWAYDRYGNRLNQNYTFDSPPTNSLSFANPGGAQTNRPDGMCFDANGNLTAESGTCPPAAPTYAYDAENRLITYSGTGGAYTYDGNNLRVKKVAAGATTVYIFSGSKVIAEYDNGAAPASPSREYIYSGAALLAKIEGGASIYYHSDHLSNRVLTDSSGNVLGQRGHYPFGDTWYESGTTTKLKFTSYERDSESTKDYAMARSYISRFARCSS